MGRAFLWRCLNNEVSGGNFTFVQQGTQGGNGYTVIHDGILIVDVDPMNWTQVGGVAAGGIPSRIQDTNNDTFVDTEFGVDNLRLQTGNNSGQASGDIDIRVATSGVGYSAGNITMYAGNVPTGSQAYGGRVVVRGGYSYDANSAAEYGSIRLTGGNFYSSYQIPGPGFNQGGIFLYSGEAYSGSSGYNAPSSAPIVIKAGDGDGPTGNVANGGPITITSGEGFGDAGNLKIVQHAHCSTAAVITRSRRAAPQ